MTEQDDAFRFVLQGQVDARLQARHDPFGVRLALLDRIDGWGRGLVLALRRFAAAGFGGAFRRRRVAAFAFHVRLACAVRGAASLSALRWRRIPQGG